MQPLKDDRALVLRGHAEDDRSPVQRAQAFDLLASRYANLYDFALEWFIGRRHRKAIPHIRGPRVLEVSFGTGYLLSQYANNFETTGVDYNPLMIAAATRRLAARGVTARLLEGDAHDLPVPDASFESLVNTDAFTVYSNPDRAMSEFYRVLVPGGRVIMMEYDFPRDRNWFGMQYMRVPRWLQMPYVDFDTTFRRAGFELTDYPVGLWGVLHLYVATKPR